MTVVGLDLSLTATGVCRLDRGAAPLLNTIGSKGTAKDTVADRAYRLQVLHDLIIAAAIELNGVPDMVVVDGPSIGSNNPHTWDRAGLWWRVLGTLYARDIPVAVVPPATLKKWSTGKGNADKAAVAVGVARLYPELECSNNNEFDALCLATMGAQTLGYPVQVLSRHREMLAKIDWPQPLHGAA